MKSESAFFFALLQLFYYLSPGQTDSLEVASGRKLNLRTLLNKVCFPNTPCEFPNTSRCVVVTHPFTALFYGLRKHTIACKETQKVCYEYTPSCLVVTHLKLMRCKCS